MRKFTNFIDHYYMPHNGKNNPLEHAVHSIFELKEMFCLAPFVQIRTTLFQSG